MGPDQARLVMGTSKFYLTNPLSIEGHIFGITYEYFLKSFLYFPILKIAVLLIFYHCIALYKFLNP